MEFIREYFMDKIHQIAIAFIHRLLANPALKNDTPLQKEFQVIQFLQNNMQTLAPTLTSPAFFPNHDLGQAMELLMIALRQLTDERLIPTLMAIVKKIDYSFVQLIRQQHHRPANIQTQILTLLEQALAKPEFRQLFLGSYTALHYDLVSRYLNETYKLRRHIHFELTKIQRLKMGKDEVKSFVEVCILLKSLVQTHVSANIGENMTGLLNENVRTTVLEQLKRELTHLPSEVVSCIVNANISFQDNPQVEATARLASIFSARGKTFVSHTSIDRGADTPDKSWVNIARRNYKFYGLDIRMLDEMYMIAAENRW